LADAVASVRACDVPEQLANFPNFTSSKEFPVVQRALILAAASLFVSTAANAQLAEDFSLPRPANCCLLNTAVTLAEQLQDWNQLSRYHTANIELMQQPVDAARVVYIGDSITDGWNLATYFPGKPYVNRGISGQTTAQMLVRFYPDVIALKPAAVIFLAGTNDIARNNGPQTLQMVQHNMMAMTELSQANGIKVIFGTILPISDRTTMPTGRGGGAGPGGTGPRPRIQSTQRPPEDILRFNAWLRSYAVEKGAGIADYYSATVDAEGFLREGTTGDGLHPNAEGYALMAPVAAAAIETALR
jgi:lysophospholipase L1-like esterase